MKIDIEDLRRKAGIAKYPTGYTCWEGQLERFAELVAEKVLKSNPAPTDRDAERLDWIQERGATVHIGLNCKKWPIFEIGGLRSTGNIDLRAAIDAAMQEGK